MAERPVVWVRPRAGQRCAGCAAQVFPGDFVQITRETGILAAGAGARPCPSQRRRIEKGGPMRFLTGTPPLSQQASAPWISLPESVRWMVAITTALLAGHQSRAAGSMLAGGLHARSPSGSSPTA
jgi:hypothetical protein